MHHRIRFFSPCLSVQRFQIFHERLSFVKTFATLGIIYATGPTKIVCLHWLTFDIFNRWTPVDHVELRALFFLLNLGNFPHALSLKRWPSIFFISDTNNSISDYSKSLKSVSMKQKKKKGFMYWMNKCMLHETPQGTNCVMVIVEPKLSIPLKFERAFSYWSQQFKVSADWFKR